MGELQTVVAALSIEFADEMYFPGVIEVSTGVLQIGRTSVTVGQIARQGGRITMYAETVLVLTGEAGPTPIPDAVRAVYERLSLRCA